MNNMINSGDLESLDQGQVLAVQARKVANGKMSVELAEIFEDSAEDGTINLSKLANKGDDRWNGKGKMRAWITGTFEGLGEMFGIDFNSLPFSINELGHEVAPLNILHPEITITTGKGEDAISSVHAVVVQVSESTTPDKWQSLNYAKSVKRKGQDGDICYHNKKAIFSNTAVSIKVARKHTFLPMDTVVPEEAALVSLETGEIFN